MSDLHERLYAAIDSDPLDVIPIAEELLARAMKAEAAVGRFRERHTPHDCRRDHIKASTPIPCVNADLCRCGSPLPCRELAAWDAALTAPESNADAPLDRFTAGLRMIARAVADAKSATRQDLVLTGPETTPDAPTGGWLTWQKLMGTEPPPFPAVLETPDAPTEETDG